jgi:hypothetical protein
MTSPQPDDMMGERPRLAGAVKRNGQPRPNAAQVLNRPVNLEGLAQVVGLAFGAPEFQRR